MKIILIVGLLMINVINAESQTNNRLLKIYDELLEIDQRLDELELDKPTKDIDSIETASTASNSEVAQIQPSLSSDNKVQTNLNITWVVVAGILVMLMQIGFALVESGLTRSKNTVHTLTMNLMDYCFGMIAFWAIGFAIMFGGVGAIESLGIGASALDSRIGFEIGGHYYSIAGSSGFFLGDDFLNTGVATLFFFQMVFAATANTICTGTLAERWRIKSFSISSFIVAGLIYPIFGHWVWGGGWLSTVFGFSDFAGSAVVHGVGGIIAFAGALVIGPRVGKYTKESFPTPIPGHNIPFVFIGTFILAFGWFGFNAGSTLAAGKDIGLIAVNTALASAAGSVIALIITQMKFGKPDPTFACNGLLAGLVAITAGCSQVSTWAAVVIGGLAGVLVVASALIFEEKFKIDDPVGAISVHGVCGLWGAIALGIFSNPNYAAPGLIYGETKQFFAQIIGVVVCILFVLPTSLILFKTIDFISQNRASDKEQEEGLDLSEMGIEAYPKDS